MNAISGIGKEQPIIYTFGEKISHALHNALCIMHYVFGTKQHIKKPKPQCVAERYKVKYKINPMSLALLSRSVYLRKKNKITDVHRNKQTYY